MTESRVAESLDLDPGRIATRPRIVESWQRSIEGGVDPERPAVQFEPFDDDDLLVRAARGVIKSTANALSDTPTWIALANPDGVVAHEWSSTDAVRSKVSSADIQRGLVLREGITGTNAVGLVLETKRPNLVRGAEHLNPGWESLSCVAGPVVHPLTREFLGVVNVTSFAREQDPFLKLTLHSLITGIQHALNQRARPRHQRLVDAHTRVRKASMAPVVTLDAVTMIVENDVSSAYLDRSLLSELANSAGAHASVLELPNGQRLQLVPVEPGTLEHGFSLVFAPGAFGPESVGTAISFVGSVRRDTLSPLEQAEYDVIVATMRACSGNKSLVANELRISRGTLYERLRRYGITG